jgi:hypothetical protein
MKLLGAIVTQHKNEENNRKKIPILIPSPGKLQANFDVILCHQSNHFWCE